MTPCRVFKTCCVPLKPIRIYAYTLKTTYLACKQTMCTVRACVRMLLCGAVDRYQQRRRTWRKPAWARWWCTAHLVFLGPWRACAGRAATRCRPGRWSAGRNSRLNAIDLSRRVAILDWTRSICRDGSHTTYGPRRRSRSGQEKKAREKIHTHGRKSLRFFSIRSAKTHMDTSIIMRIKPLSNNRYWRKFSRCRPEHILTYKIGGTNDTRWQFTMPSSGEWVCY